MFGIAVAINGGDRIAAGSVSLSNEEYVDGYVKAFSLDGGFVQVDLSLDGPGAIDSIVATNGIYNLNTNLTFNVVPNTGAWFTG